MELATTFKSQTVHNRVREVGINPNYWYPVLWADQLKVAQVMPAVIWQQAIVVYRDANAQLHALEDACPHKGVALHKGKVQGTHLACRYHGWEFDGSGKCVSIPYLPQGQKLPCAQARSYPIQEKYNLIWIFPGDASLSEQCKLPEVPEFDQPEWLMVPIPTHFKAHFSICNENTMDVFHGYLHQDLQGWFDPVLINLQATETSVCADYKVSYKGTLSKFLGLSDSAHKVTTRTISIRYHYPHYHSSLEGLSSLYLMRLPVSLTETRSFSLFFVKVRLPKWILQPIEKLLAHFIWRLFRKFVAQDMEMIESEQQSYLANPERRYVEINPAIVALQRVLILQYEQSLQKFN
ncbi:hypothetical protein NUACC21_45220 [Scytonema sp. NUACC21]